MTTDSIHVYPRDSIGTITPEIYGHFQEHIGQGIYDGIWVGESEDREHIAGLRQSTIDLLHEVRPPVFRWPGGCFADDYHWEYAVGPQEERERYRNLWWIQGPDDEIEESNAFGTDEFMRFCREVGAMPYLSVNLGTGTPEEAMGWMEYCNYDGETKYATMRAENGHEEPYEVRYWGIGNENWGCGGQLTPEAYATDYSRFASYLDTFNRGMVGGKIAVEFVACGDTDQEWNRRFLDAVIDESATEDWHRSYYPDHLSIHRYIGKRGCGGDTTFSEEEYYRLFVQAMQIEQDIAETAAVIAPRSLEASVAVDEWGIWHPEAVHENGLSQKNTVRDALVAATFLDVFNANVDVVSMANLAQTVNVLQCLVETDTDRAWPTPTYHVFDLYRPHMNSTAVRSSVETSKQQVTTTDDEGEATLPLIGRSISRSGDELCITATNRHLEIDRTVCVETGLDSIRDASARSLFADHAADEYSSGRDTDRFTATDQPVSISGTDVVVSIPSASIVRIDVEGTL